MTVPFLRFVTKATALTCAVALVPSFAAPASAQPAQRAYNAAATAIIDGTVTDSAGKALSGVLVSAGGTPPITATTDAAGHFSLAVVPGVYDVTFAKSGFSEFDAGDQPVIANDRRTLTVSLVDATLTSLRTIGRVTSRGLRPTLNTATSSVSALPGHVITERQTPDLALLGTELPGVTQQRGNASPNSDFVIRGALQEANTAVDGHIIRAGNFGALLTSYIPGQSFGQIEVTKGPGNFGPTAGDSVFGTINLRTPDFAPGNFADVVEGIETRFNTPYSSYLGNANLLGDRLSLLGQYVVDGTAKPGQGMTGFGAINSGAVPIIAFATDFTAPLQQRSETLKARYKFSDVTALTLGFFGVQGTLRPQGGGYATSLGNVQLFPCNTATGPGAIFPATVPGNVTGAVAQCDQYSAYNPPAYQALGNAYASVPLFNSLNPASQVLDSEPQFEAEFKTSVGGGTLLFRPSATLINRTIDGALEASTPGLSVLQGSALPKGVGQGSFYRVTNPGNCAPTFTAPNPAMGLGASGPCFQGSNPTPFVNANNPCSPSNPCYAAVTATDTAGRVNFATPFNQTQVDKDRDVQLTYQKQFGPHSLQLGYDYNSDDNSNISGDPSGFLLARTATPVLPDPTGFQTVGNSSLSYPRSIQRRNDLQLSGLFQLGDKLQLALGDYYTNARLGFSVVDPTLVAYVNQQLVAKNPNFNSGTFGSNPLSYISLASGYLDKTLVVHHNDPQIGFTYSPTRDVAVRASAGSSTFVPYASQVSGKPRISLQTTSSSPYPTETFPNANLLPETAIAYDLGADLRYPNGLFSFDVFHNTIHNKQASYTQLFAPGTEPIPTGLTTATTPYIAVNETFNAPIQRSYGLEVNLDGTREAGFGYRLTGTFERDFYDQLPLGFYRGQNTTIINGAQIYNQAPFSQAYGELNFHSLAGFEVLGGLQYTGANNQTLGPAYTIGLVSLRAPLVTNRVFIQGTIDNLFNYTPVGLGGVLGNAGFPQVQFGSSSQTAAPTFSTRTANLQYVQPRTIRLQLSTHVGTGSGPTSITGVAPVNVPTKTAPPAQ